MFRPGDFVIRKSRTRNLNEYGVIQKADNKERLIDVLWDNGQTENLSTFDIEGNCFIIFFLKKLNFQMLVIFFRSLLDEMSAYVQPTHVIFGLLKVFFKSGVCCAWEDIS